MVGMLTVHVEPSSRRVSRAIGLPLRLVDGGPILSHMLRGGSNRRSRHFLDREGGEPWEAGASPTSMPVRLTRGNRQGHGCSSAQCTHSWWNRGVGGARVRRRQPDLALGNRRRGIGMTWVTTSGTKLTSIDLSFPHTLVAVDGPALRPNRSGWTQLRKAATLVSAPPNRRVPGLSPRRPQHPSEGCNQGVPFAFR